MSLNPYKSPSDSETFEASELPQMQCPHCGKSMEFGYFPTTGVYWMRPGESSFVWSEARALPGTRGFFSLRGARIYSFRCEPCEMVVFHYGSRKLEAK